MILSRFLKDASSRIAFPLASIFSDSLETGVFPDNLKLARISAIFKGKSSRSNPDHYRPISAQALHGLAPKCKLINMHELINKSTNDYVTLLPCENGANVNNKG